jgi:hypothetical protein
MAKTTPTRGQRVMKGLNLSYPARRFSHPRQNVLSSYGKRRGEGIAEDVTRLGGGSNFWRDIVNLNELLKAALKTGLYFLERSDKATAPMRKQVKDQVEGLTDRTRQAILGPEDHTGRNAVSLAAGIGLGVAFGMFFAPASGDEIRRSLVGKVRDARAKIRGHFPPEEGLY